MPVVFKNVVVFSIALCMLACSKKEPGTSSEASSTTVSSTTVAATQAPVPAPTTPASSTGATQTSSSMPTPVSASVIATTEGEVPGLRVDVTELKRTSGGNVSLKFVLHNDSGKEIGYGNHWLGDGKVSSDYYSVGGVHLIDPVGKKKYFVTRDTEEKCVCSTNLSNVISGSQTNLWAKFPAPPPDVKQVTVVIPHFTPMDDVPIQ